MRFKLRAGIHYSDALARLFFLDVGRMPAASQESIQFHMVHGKLVAYKSYI